MCCTATFTVRGDLPAVGEARRRAASALTTCSVDLIDSDTLSDIGLLVSELVTNAVQAGSVRVRVEIAVHRREIRIDVSDDAPGWPVLRTAAPGDTSGRGLAIMHATTTDWGVTAVDGGKTVWAVVPLPDLLGALAGCRL